MNTLVKFYTCGHDVQDEARQDVVVGVAQGQGRQGHRSTAPQRAVRLVEAGKRRKPKVDGKIAVRGIDLHTIMVGIIQMM